MFCVSEDDVRKEHLKKLIIWINLFHITLAVCLEFAWRRCYYIFKALFFILGMALMLHTVSLSFSFYSIIEENVLRSFLMEHRSEVVKVVKLD